MFVKRKSFFWTMINVKLPNADIKGLYDRSKKFQLLSAETKRLNSLQLFGGIKYLLLLGQNINKELHLSQGVR